MNDKTQTKKQVSLPAVTEWNQQIKWMTETRELTFTPEDIKREFSENPNVTLKECVIFMQKCVSHRLDPYLGDAHLIKFGTAPAQLIVGKYAFLKIAQRSRAYDGYKAGIIILDKNNTVHRREGSMVLPGEQLIGGWGQVFRKDQKVPAYEEAGMNEYTKKTKDGRTNSQWSKMPATMIRKVGLVHALRECFPEDLRGMYDESEVDAIKNSTSPEDYTTKTRLNEIFKKQDATVIEGEAVEVKEIEEEPDVLTNELKIYVKALNININSWLEKAHCKSIEQLPPDVKQKCIDSLKPKYLALKKKEESKQKDMLAEDSVAKDVAEVFD